MKATVLYGPRDVRFEERPDPAIKEAMMKRILFLILILAMVLVNATGAADQASVQGIVEEASTLKIRIDVEGTVITATLIDNATSRDFVSLLPLTLTLRDYAATEKISDLPRRLSTEGAPAGHDPSIGDIAYYAPWGNLAIFYRDFSYSPGLIHLGTIEASVEALSGPGPLSVTIELIEE